MRYKEGLYWVVIGAALGVAFYLYWQNRRVQTSLQQLNTEKALADLRINADECFITGQIDSAFTLYKRIDTLTGDSLVHRRMRQLALAPDTSAYHETINRLNMQLHFMNSSLLACRRHYTALSEAMQNMRRDTVLIPSPACAEVPSLHAKIDSLQLLVESAQKRGFLEFYSSKNAQSIAYFGEIVDSMANGYGVGYWRSTGSIYTGYWKANKRHGRGIFEWADGERYEGEYYEDKRHGYGVYISKAGRYEGYWEDDMRHGEGKLYEVNGKLRVHGIWEKDKLQKVLK